MLYLIYEYKAYTTAYVTSRMPTLGARSDRVGSFHAF